MKPRQFNQRTTFKPNPKRVKLSTFNTSKVTANLNYVLFLINISRDFPEGDPPCSN
jgi:hypothetical protein